jgi:hypothetical protein
MKQLWENDHVFGMVGNVGTPKPQWWRFRLRLTIKCYSSGLSPELTCFDRFQPDHYVFTYRASYSEIHDFDMGPGTLLNFGPSEKVWGTQLDKSGHFNAIDLE